MRFECGGENVLRKLAVGCLKKRQLRSASEEARRARFIVGDVRFLVGKNDSVGRAQGRQSEGVSCSARGNRKCTHLRTEISAQTRIESRGPRVVAIGSNQTVVRLSDRRQHLRGSGSSVITQKTQLCNPHSERQRNAHAPKARKINAVTPR